jgi:uncharacterized protein
MAPRSAWTAIPLALLALATAQPAAAAAVGPAKGFGRTVDPLEGAKNAIRLKNFTAAQSDLQRLADAGNADAQYMLAVFFLNGLGGPRDPVQAKGWLEKSASQGNPRAAFSLASLYAEADPPDAQAAQRWFTRARELGFTAQPRGPQKAGATAESILIPATRITDAKVKREALWLAAEQGDVASLEALASAPLVTEADEFGRGALARAAEAGHAPALEVLLRRGAPVDAADQYGMTALMLAARAGSADSVEVLLRSRANVNAVDHKGNTALMHAAAGGKADAVERLLAGGAGVSARNVQDWSALDFAEIGGAREAAARLKEKGAVALKRSSASSETALTAVQRAPAGRDVYAGWPDLAVAAARPAPDLLQSLLAHGADPDATTPQGLPILSVAVLSGAPATIETLLGAGAHATHGDRHGSSPLLTATREGREDVVKALLAHGVAADGSADDPEPPLVAAAKAGHLDIVHTLTAAHAHIDARDPYGTSALMVVAQRNDSPNALRELVEAGASTEAVDKAGRTALWYAARAGRSENVRVLLQRGANGDHADESGVTPLSAACSARASGTAELLLQKGVHLEARTARGDTALLLAASAGSSEIVDRLLAQHANQDAQNEFGDTALIIASREGNDAMVQRLLKAGASTRLRNKDHHSAADVAAARSFSAIADLLKSA